MTLNQFSVTYQETLFPSTAEATVYLLVYEDDSMKVLPVMADTLLRKRIIKAKEIIEMRDHGTVK